MRAVTILLLFVIVVLAGSFPSALSQSFTTVTNVLTTTGLLTSTVYSTNTIGTSTSTVVITNTFVSTTDTDQKPTNSRGCYYDYWNITVDPGTIEITGTIGPPSSQIDFYIMNQQQYLVFHRSECGSTPYDAEVAVYSLSSIYTLDWKNPTPGWYYVIFSNTATGGTGLTVTTPFVLVNTYNQAETSTVYNVVTNQATLPVTQTLTSVEVTQASTIPGPSLNLDPTLIAGIVIVIVAVLGGLLFAKSRKEKKPSKVGDKAFCIKCGKELPASSKFCNKCGTVQE